MPPELVEGFREALTPTCGRAHSLDRFKKCFYLRHTHSRALNPAPVHPASELRPRLAACSASRRLLIFSSFPPTTMEEVILREHARDEAEDAAGDDAIDVAARAGSSRRARCRILDPARDAEEQNCRHARRAA